ncbi:hypothetical protein VIGAN_08330400 [Vigna angularis var. angularis]|uniref:C2H2-type domain-containing protein n=1 Tax=Vigna angularis var. angularis TaxID=157739 RepID=A0A0S3SU53_PHAAN|nr:hypothetical protein VIGAN_08330400 [Vigna angularis var. angularis]
MALSPKSLLAINKFICEICNKGFQRWQNLQHHRRGHNFLWKLKQRTSKEVRKKVYVCLEPICVHHDTIYNIWPRIHFHTFHILSCKMICVRTMACLTTLFWVSTRNLFMKFMMINSL